MPFKGKNCLITGSARGLGKEMALVLAREGCNIIINDIEAMRQEAMKTAEEIKKLDVACEFIPADVTNYDSCKKMAEQIKKQFKNLDILINNAGITKDRTLRKMAPEEWNPVISVNCSSLYNVTHNVLELMHAGARIINISSISGIMGNFGQTNYSATKAAVIGFTKALSRELGKDRITVNAVAPGFIKSPMTDKMPFLVKKFMKKLIPIGDFGEPKHVANAVKFLASEDAEYITGNVLVVSGGFI